MFHHITGIHSATSDLVELIVPHLSGVSKLSFRISHICQVEIRLSSQAKKEVALRDFYQHPRKGCFAKVTLTT